MRFSRLSLGPSLGCIEADVMITRTSYQILLRPSVGAHSLAEASVATVAAAMAVAVYEHEVPRR